MRSMLNKIKQRQADNLLRERIAISSRLQNENIIDGNKVINFCHNDYLGLATDAVVSQSLQTHALEFGLGSGASALVSGYSSLHQRLEREFASFMQREAALLFNSGYLANLGVINALASKDSVIIADKLCHASIIDAILLSRAEYCRYQHQNLAHLELRLQQYPHREKIVITESVFSMEGDISNLAAIAALANQYQAILMVDDAHGLGVLGKRGAGTCDLFGLTSEMVPLVISPLGKAMGSMGALVSGDADLIESIMQLARSYHYTTALPPAIVGATLSALQLLQQDHWRRQRLNQLIDYFLILAHEYKLPLASYDKTPIKAILVNDNQKVIKMRTDLLAAGFFIAAIRAPTVPANQARLRLTLNCFHTEQQIAELVSMIAAAL